MKKLIIMFMIVCSSAFAGVRIMKGDYVYAIHKNHLEETIQAGRNGDREMFRKFVSVLQLSETGGISQDGKEVYITDRDWSGYVQFYFKGNPQRYWISKEAIE